MGDVFTGTIGDDINSLVKTTDNSPLSSTMKKLGTGDGSDSNFYLGANKVGINEAINITATSTEINYLDGVTSDIQTQLDSKVGENAAITGATKTKITYDAKGLVTSGTDATTADIADSTNKRYVTDAEKTVIGNTSGTNTGDNAANSTYASAKTKTDLITITQPVDLDTIESDTATNNAKVTNATHTGEVTGSGILTVDKTAITNKTAITPATNDYILISDTSDSDNLKKALISDLPSSGITTAVDIQAFTSSGVYTKPSGAKYIKLIMLGAGGGGGSGRRGAAGTLRTGGGGGGSGQVVIVDIPASAVGSTETVTIGAGGAGGTAVPSDSTNGNAGTAGGNTTFGSIVRANGASGGAAGNNSGAGAGGGQVGASSQFSIAGTTGGSSSATGGNGSGGNSQTINVAPSAGGGGGGISTADAAGTGGAGGNVNISNWIATGYTGINGGTANNAGNVTAALVHYHGLTIGSGGGGGTAVIGSAANAGGAGGGPGAAGGGGGASLNGNNSGAGGAGQNGWCVVITYL